MDYTIFFCMNKSALIIYGKILRKNYFQGDSNPFVDLDIPKWSNKLTN
jgi:hypothetical protein